MVQVLVSVRFQGYYLQLLIARDSKIRNIVEAVRQNTFIPAEIPDNSLRYKNSNDQVVTLDDAVEKIISNQENNVHYLEVQVIQGQKTEIEALKQPIKTNSFKQQAAQVLISVRFQGYYLQLLIAQDSKIRDIVEAIRQNKFIPANIPDNSLRYKNSNDQVVTLDDAVEKIILKQGDKIHCLQVQVIQGQKTEIEAQKNQAGRDYLQQQTNKILERIVKYLKEQNVQSLLKAKTNARIQATMAQHLSSIGQAFKKLQMKSQFYEKSLQTIAKSKSNQQANQQIEKVFSNFQDFATDSQMNLVKDVLNKKCINLQNLQNEI